MPGHTSHRRTWRRCDSRAATGSGKRRGVRRYSRAKSRLWMVSGHTRHRTPWRRCSSRAALGSPPFRALQPFPVLINLTICSSCTTVPVHTRHCLLLPGLTLVPFSAQLQHVLRDAQCGISDKTARVVLNEGMIVRSCLAPLIRRPGTLGLLPAGAVHGQPPLRACHRLRVRPARHCSPHHIVTSDSREEGENCVSITWRA
jgi:hypothetical protein